ncbi:MAG: ABC transporter ATP-binding protein [Chloroflexota bacterium]
MTYLRLEGIQKAFGSTVALHGVDLEVERGELVSFLGPSGCGKTTTLRIIAGFERPDAGRVILEERDLTDIQPERRGMGMVFQSYGLFPNMTASQNIAFGLRMARRPAAEIRARVTEMLDLIALPEIAARYPNQLSGGQQQRVALARAIAIEPRVLLLDEPLSALDAVVRTSLRMEIREIQQRTGITAIYVTHDQEEALTISDRIVVLDHGRIEQIGSPREVYERPATAFVASFIGQTNRFEGRVVDADQGLVRVASRLLRVPPGPLLVQDAIVQFVVRPERLVFDPGGTLPPEMNRLEGTVLAVTYLGATDMVSVDVDGRRVVVTAPAGRSGPPSPGRSIGLAFDVESCHLIGSADGSEPLGGTPSPSTTAERR